MTGARQVWYPTDRQWEEHDLLAIDGKLVWERASEQLPPPSLEDELGEREANQEKARARQLLNR